MCSGASFFIQKMLFYPYRNSHYKDKTVSWLSYLYNRNHCTWKNYLDIETAPCYAVKPDYLCQFQNCPWSFICSQTLTQWGQVTHICVSKLTIIGWHLVGAKPLSEPMLEYCRLDPWEQTSVQSLKPNRYLYHPHNKVVGGVYWFHSVRPSVRPSAVLPVGTLHTLEWFWVSRRIFIYSHHNTIVFFSKTSVRPSSVPHHMSAL